MALTHSGLRELAEEVSRRGFHCERLVKAKTGRVLVDVSSGSATYALGTCFLQKVIRRRLKSGDVIRRRTINLMAARHIKCVLVGDAAVGKKCLFFTFTCKWFPEDNFCPPSHPDTVNMLVDDMRINLDLWYAAGQQDYDYLRPLSYSEADVFLVCFSVASAASFHNVSMKWVPELRHHAPLVPIVLVGTKTDLRGVDSSVSCRGELLNDCRHGDIDDSCLTPDLVFVAGECCAGVQ